MKKIQQGNDIPISWTITKNSSISLSDASVELVDALGNVATFDATITETNSGTATVTGTFYGKNQTTLGKYNLRFVKGDKQITLYHTKAFILVEKLHNNIYVGADEDTVETTTVELTSNITTNSSSGIHDVLWNNTSVVEDNIAYLKSNELLADVYSDIDELQNTTTMFISYFSEINSDISDLQDTSYLLSQDYTNLSSQIGDINTILAAKSNKVSKETTTATAITLTPDTLCVCSTPIVRGVTLSIALQAAADNVYAHEYRLRFSTGTTKGCVDITGFTFPADDDLSIEVNKTYEINVCDGLGVWQSWDNA